MPRALVLILAYFAIQSLSFAVARTGGDVDTAEMLLYTQYWDWGYGGSQPPLYDWLALAVTHIFGVSLLTFSGLKFAMLTLAFASVAMGARAMGLRRPAAAAAAVGLFAIPEIGWEAQRALSHSVALLATSGLAFWVVAEIRRRDGRNTALYLALGVAVAATMLAKYNAAIYLTALALACAAHPAWRGVVLARGMWLTLGLAALLLAPHLVWLAGHADALTIRAQKLGIGAADGELAARLAGLLALARANLLTGGVLFLIAGIALARGLRLRLRPLRADPAQLPMLVFVIGNALFAAGVLVFGMTGVLNRWLQPILLMLPLAVVRIGAGPGPGAEAESAGRGAWGDPARWVLLTGAGFALAAMIALPLSIHGRASARPARDMMNYAGLYARLADAAGQPPRAVVTENYGYFANLRLIDGDLRIVHPFVPRAGALSRWPTLLIWTGGATLPDDLARFSASLGLARPNGPVLSWAMPRVDAPQVTLPVHFMVLGAPSQPR